MNNQKGYTRWVIVILISVMAVGLVGAAWYYEENKEEKINTPSTTATITNVNMNTIATDTNTAVNTNAANNFTLQNQLFSNNVYSYQVTLPAGWVPNTDEFCSIQHVGFGKGIYKCPPDGGGWIYNISAIENSTLDTLLEKYADDIVVDESINGLPVKHYLHPFTSEYLGGDFTNEGYYLEAANIIFHIHYQTTGTVTDFNQNFVNFANSFDLIN